MASGASAVSRASTAEKTAGGIKKREPSILPEYCLKYGQVCVNESS
jgi:hypothetical protein